MSYFYIGVGGTGAKLMQTLIHLSAAGMLPERGRSLDALLVDPDEANGNVDDCQHLLKAYRKCTKLGLGQCDLFNATVDLQGPWSPTRQVRVNSLNDIFQYSQRQLSAPLETDLMDLLFDPVERAMEIDQGFRGRPAIGATVFGNAINFDDDTDVWFKLRERAKSQAGSGRTAILFSGSVFGGSGAAGVPTIFRLLKGETADKLANLRLGLILFLPYFKFSQIPGEAVQADPNAFATAAAEALKYYDERHFLDLCDSIYTVGERKQAAMPVSSVGAGSQRNEPHFLELIAALGALRFFGSKDETDHTLSIAVRKQENTVTWSDLPGPEFLQVQQREKLQQMVLFAVMYHFLWFPNAIEGGKDTTPMVKRHLGDFKVLPADYKPALTAVEEYMVLFLNWLLRISLPRRDSFVPGLVTLDVFADGSGAEWSLKPTGRATSDYVGKHLSRLFPNVPGMRKLDAGDIYNAASKVALTDTSAAGTGRLLRAMYDACQIRKA